MIKLVSILIPACNAKRWLIDTLVSVIGQNWPRKWIILFEDDSSDLTSEIAWENT